MSERINITDLDLIKITKVKNWAVNFDYGDEHYLLHESESDCETSISLYRRTYNEYGVYKLEWINGYSPFSGGVSSHFISNWRKHSIVYSQIDKEFFVYQLTYFGLASGIMEEKVDKNAKRVAELKEEISRLERVISDLRLEIRRIE